MNDEQIVEYCRKMIIANLNQYTDTENSIYILREIYELTDTENKKILLEHCKGVKELLEKGIEILEKDNGRN